MDVMPVSLLLCDQKARTGKQQQYQLLSGYGTAARSSLERTYA